ncbi:MAG: hypothetical protein ABI231_00595 [Candidatus Tumulicola sp.]
MTATKRAEGIEYAIRLPSNQIALLKRRSKAVVGFYNQRGQLDAAFMPLV